MSTESVRQYEPGEAIGGEFKVLKVFGGEELSGMGVVYLVHHREYPEPFVLKTFQHGASDEAKRQFVSEAHAWIKAGAHSNIVQAYWVREVAGQLFVAAEYVQPDAEGRNTLTHFLTNSQLPLELIFIWAAQFCHGMDYARSKGVLVHRDIKPDNLMIERALTLKIADFGLAKSIDLEAVPQRAPWWAFRKKQDAETISRTKTGSAMGTLSYMAPEQFVNAKAADHRADLYSFGIVLYQMVTGGGYPYLIRSEASDIQLEFVQAHLKQAPLRVESPLMPAISRCLEKNPGRRYPTYGALLTALTDLAQGLRIIIPPQVHVAKEDEELYAQAQSYSALGDKDRALKAIDEYVSKYPDNACGWTEKGRIHHERGEYQQGLAATKRSIELSPYNTHAWNNLGNALRRTEAPFTEIRKAFDTALYFDPGNTAAMMNFIEPLVLQRKYSEAAALTARALKLRPEKPSVLGNAEALLEQLRDKRELAAARILLEGWTAARPTDAHAWLCLGLIFLDGKDLDEAIRCFEQIRLRYPEDNFVLVQLAKLYFQTKNGAACLDCCNTLLLRAHETLLAVTLKARVINLMGFYAQALNFLKPYFEQSPKNDTLWVALADIHEYRHNYDAAIEALFNAKRILEDDSIERNADNLQFVNLKVQELMQANRTSTKSTQA